MLFDVNVVVLCYISYSHIIILGVNMTIALKDQYVRARVPQALKEDAEQILQQVGLSTSDAIRLFLTQIVNRGHFPLELQSPNQVTVHAMQSDPEPEIYNNADELFKDILG